MWHHGGEGALVPFEPELAQRLEVAFQSFWADATAPASVALEPFGAIDFRTMELCGDGHGCATGPRHPVYRREEQPGTMVAGSSIVVAAHVGGPEQRCGAELAASAVEWGHGQDAVRGCAFAPYSAGISRLLEDAFRQYRESRGLKGVMFTSTNGADYLVDFERMEQTRLATRNVRPVYRHSVSLCVRGPGGVPKASQFAAPASDGEPTPGAAKAA
eukprot:CAMPEP_0179025784 /NCGR_PEP_ID=MMETSP0796-20121207/8170_1 /TAXON_ID=73915 /ORGANISM="Pyrodinium bahamense, Strain pbaha01" /LENGTH=215 /DNA_ID=CAMNT_0020721829 /DNA_START=33 /DNA_END=676 /DNA_ORIENTATION=+